ncbi:FecR family protein [Chryseosolibacter indicus]|uniref:FecR domain-containing protein n=1 Tax=Chryseosolibacter indicus TaxID=2782351 RepID=A0ABS5VUP9_9BACT|nr:FecR domain-containing protein [Chryseosolibacter indicus]MBT1704555.1 FecR domain-containing protein [Chryseosolibacter indicus]
MRIQPDQYYRDLISGFLEKQLSDAELDELKSWLMQDASHKEYFDKVNENYQTTKILDQFNSEKIDNAWLKLSEKINGEKNRHFKQRTISQYYYNFLRVAASVSILVLTSLLLWKLYNSVVTPTSDLIVVENSQTRNTHIVLPDGSLVWLNGSSTIEYNSDFGKTNRQVKLNGEAFFDVKKKDNQNFIVRTNNISVRVKGTRFNVSAYKGQEVKTTLEEGKVELSLYDDKVYPMVPGEQIIVNDKENRVVLQKVDPADYTAWKEEKLLFDNTPLADIILKLENRYKVDIVVDAQVASRERLTMTIHQETIDEIMEMIQLSSRLNWKKTNNQILIYE